MGTLQIFNYNGNNVTFSKDGATMINATEMAKPFGKLPAQYLRLPSAKQLIQAIVSKSHIDINQLVVTRRGGLTPSTWMHEDIALDFAQWLSIDFKLWCNDRIKELMRIGVTATPQALEEMLTNPDFLIAAMTELKRTRQEKELLQAENQKLRPRSEFIDRVFESKDTYTMSEAAKLLNLNFGRTSLYQTLRNQDMIFKHSTEPKQEYIKKGYFELKAVEYDTGKNGVKIGTQTLVTQKGLAAIAKLLNVIVIN